MGLLAGLFSIYTACQLFGLAAERFGFWPTALTVLAVLWVLSRVAKRQESRF